MLIDDNRIDLFIHNELIKQIGIAHQSISGDTRLDRVHSIAAQAQSLPIVNLFLGESE